MRSWKRSSLLRKALIARVELLTIAHRHHEGDGLEAADGAEAPLDVALAAVAHEPRQLDLHQIDGGRHRRRVGLPQPRGNELVGRAAVQPGRPVPEQGLGAGVGVQDAPVDVEGQKGFGRRREDLSETIGPRLDLRQDRPQGLLNATEDRLTVFLGPAAHYQVKGWPRTRCCQ